MSHFKQPAQPQHGISGCRLLQPRSRHSYCINPSSLCPDLDIKVAVRLAEEGECRAYDHCGLLDCSYFGSAELLLEKFIDSPCQFDVFALDRFVEQPVHHFGMFLFNRCGLFQMDSGLYLEPIICSWLLRKITGLYHYRNPYHNQLHAIDVTQAFYTMMCQPGIKRRLHLNKLEVFATLLAALCHDVDHPGCTAKYLCLFNHQNFFKAYNDRTCELNQQPKGKIQFTLENHHTKMGHSLLVQSGLMESLGLTERQRSSTIRLMSDLINATDMDRHKSLVEKFEADLLLAKSKKSENSNNDDGASTSCTSQVKTVKMDLLELIIKCADIGNPFRQWHICNAWAELVCQEFYQQGDLENLCKKYCMTEQQLQQLPPYTGSLKRTAKIASVQVGFIGFFVMPLIKVYTEVEATQSSKVLQHTVEQNLKLWKLLDKMSRESILEYVESAVGTVPTGSLLDAILDRLLAEQKITVTVRTTC